MFYIPIAGTWGANDPWVVSNDGAFTAMMGTDGLQPLRNADRTPIFNWSGKLQGLWWTGEDDWRAYGVLLADLLEQMPYDHRNLIAHSHGGNVAQNAANVLAARAKGIRIRTLTTVGTPVRTDTNSVGAAAVIDFWQHIYDKKWDWMGTLKRDGVVRTLGKIGDGSLTTERRFLIPGVLNIGVEKISHSEVLNDPIEMRRWIDDGWNRNIRTAGGRYADTRQPL